jgi:hypothetical protein
VPTLDPSLFVRLFQNPTLLKLSERYALITLLWLAYLLEGCAAPRALLIWSFGVLLFILSRVGVLVPHWAAKIPVGEIALALGLLLFQFLAKQPTTTAYDTAEAMLFLMLWSALKVDAAALPGIDGLIKNLAAMGAISLAATILQLTRGLRGATYGNFPGDPLLNAAWLACMGVALLIYGLEHAPDGQGHWESFRYPALILAVIFIIACAAFTDRGILPALSAGLIYALIPSAGPSPRRVSIAILIILALAPFTVVWQLPLFIFLALISGCTLLNRRKV